MNTRLPCLWCIRGDVGSVVMFAIPSESGERALGESFLQTLEAKEVTQRRNGGAPDIVLAGVECLRERIARLAELVQSGRVQAGFCQSAGRRIRHPKLLECLSYQTRLSMHSIGTAHALIYLTLKSY